LQILVGVTGGIAAYKAAGVIRGFTELGHNVKVLPTQNALRFIGATTLEALSHNKVDPELYTDVDSVKHIALAQEADLIVVAPATAAFIARYAAGIADDLLLNVLLASKAVVVIAPAMHTEMWLHPATKENIAKLVSRGVHVIEPDSGRLTGDDSGLGRLPEPESIVNQSLQHTAKQDLAGIRITIAAGGTREPIDAVRFIGNKSSGKQGIALAEVAASRGAQVTLIAINLDKVFSKFDSVIQVSSYLELQSQLHDSGLKADLLFMPAAVSDFRVEHPSTGKLSRSDDDSLTLTLIANEDILASLAKQRTQVGSNTKIIGFAAEVLPRESSIDELKQRALLKLDKKVIEMIVANNVADGAVFGSENNSVVIVTAGNTIATSGSKADVAEVILTAAKALLE
jgi:phosphopantothenoylcysteine decarboxylase/phosphopantothenate--cysteine ligase